MQNFHDLPLEIIGLIVDQLRDQKDLKRLCEVSKHLNHHTTPRLYGSITISSRDESNICYIDVESLLSMRTKPDNNLKYVKDVLIVAPFDKRLRHRCIDDSTFRNSDESLVGVAGADILHSICLTRLESNLCYLLGGLADNNLQSFSWNLGICMPRKVSSYLSKKQKQIESLSLISDPTCSSPVGTRLSFHRSPFNCLRSFSWQGIHEVRDGEVVATLLCKNAEHLEQIKLDFIAVSEGVLWNNSDDTPNRFATDILMLKLGERRTLFPSLRDLSLSAVFFAGAPAEIAAAFDIPTLRSLKLRNCQGMNALLKELTSSGQAIKITRLEIELTVEIEDDQDIWPLFKFLSSFQGLEDLYVLSDESEHIFMDYWQAVVHHKSTLKRTVHQQRMDKTRNSIGYFNHNLIYWYEVVEEMLLGPKLEAVGLCAKPISLAVDLVHTHPRPKLQLLHFRTSALKSSDPTLADMQTSSISSYSATDDLEELDMSDGGSLEHESSSSTGAGAVPSGNNTHAEAAWSRNDERDGQLPWESEIDLELAGDPVPSASPWRTESSSEPGDDYLPTCMMSETPEPEEDPIPSAFLASPEGKNASEAFGETPHQVLRFAQWAFSPDGLPELRILAFGNFSHQGRYKNHNVLLCRSKASTEYASGELDVETTPIASLMFREVTEEDWSLQDMIRANMDMLEACPEDTLIWEL